MQTTRRDFNLIYWHPSPCIIIASICDVYQVVASLDRPEGIDLGLPVGSATVVVFGVLSSKIRLQARVVFLLNSPKVNCL